MIEIDFEEPTYHVYETEQGEIEATRLSRLIRDDDDVFAAYYAEFVEANTAKEVMCLIGLGEWGENSGPEHRVAFPVSIWLNEEGHYAVTIMGKEASPFAEAELFGTVFTRDQALEHPFIESVYKITDLILTEDQTITDYFSE